MFHKSMNCIRRLNRENVYLSIHSFKMFHLIRGMKVVKKYKISVQFLYNCSCRVPTVMENPGKKW